MAVLDALKNTIVIRVVYDGPPEAGKTTSLRALGRSLGREVSTPEEKDGRTVYFDWMEYVGGRYDGRQIRCQVATVPGQRARARRRAYFLDDADVVVFVGDTSAAAWPETLAHLRALRAQLSSRAAPSVGIVFQANKRDRADRVPIEVVRAVLTEERIGVVESVAHENQGIREAFVLSVRLALDRVRELAQRGELAASDVALVNEDDLLAALRGLAEPAGAEPAGSPALAAAGPTFVPRAPSADGPVGVMWPPVDGRTILHEVAALGVRPRLTERGDCVAGLGVGWRLHSCASAVFTQLDEGRSALVAWARRHAAARELLSAHRCIVLADNGDGRWRLWQIVRAQVSLREVLLEDGPGLGPMELAQRLALASRTLLDAGRIRQAHQLPIECSTRTIGVDPRGSPVYVALMPGADEPAAPEATSDSVAHELAALFRDRLDVDPDALREALRRVSVSAFSFDHGRRVSEVFNRLLAL